MSKYGKFPGKIDTLPGALIHDSPSQIILGQMLAWLALIIISIAIGVDPFHSLRSKVDTAAAALHEEEEEVDDDDDFNEVGRVKKIKHIFRSIK